MLWPLLTIRRVWRLIVKSSYHVLLVYPDSKIHGANMGPIWGRQDPGGPHVDPMNLAIWVAVKVVRLMSHVCSRIKVCHAKFYIMLIQYALWLCEIGLAWYINDIDDGATYCITFSYIHHACYVAIAGVMFSNKPSIDAVSYLLMNLLNPLAPGRCGCIFKVQFPNSLYRIVGSALARKLLSYEFHITSRMRNQYCSPIVAWCRRTTRQQCYKLSTMIQNLFQDIMFRNRKSFQFHKSSYPVWALYIWHCSPK